MRGASRGRATRCRAGCRHKRSQSVGREAEGRAAARSELSRRGNQVRELGCRLEQRVASGSWRARTKKGLLPGLADVQHALGAGPPPQALLCDLVLALALAEAHHLDAVAPGKALEGGDEGAC